MEAGAGQEEGGLQPNGDGSLSPMPVRGSPLAVAPAWNERAASLTACAGVEESSGGC